MLINWGKRLWRVYLNLIGNMLWILPISVGDITYKECDSWFKREAWEFFFKNQFSFCQMKQMKDVKGTFHSPGWLLWLLSNSRVILTFYNSLSFSLIGGRIKTKERMVCTSQRAWKGDRFRDKNLLRSIRDAHYLSYFNTLRQGLLCRSGVRHWKYGSRPIRTGRVSSPLWRNVSQSGLRGRVGKSPRHSLCTCSVIQSYLTPCDPTGLDPMDPVHRISWVRILEWVAILVSRGSSQPKYWTRISCTAGRLFTIWATREACHSLELCRLRVGRISGKLVRGLRHLRHLNL